MPDKGKQGSWTSFPKREYVNELIESQGEIPHWVVTGTFSELYWICKKILKIYNTILM